MNPSRVLALVVTGLACNSSAPARERGYVPRVRALTVTTVPLLVREQQGVFPFLKQDFAKGGLLEGKEVYAFSPSLSRSVASP